MSTDEQRRPSTDAGGWFDPVTGDGYAPDQPHAAHDRCFWAGFHEGKREAGAERDRLEAALQGLRSEVEAVCDAYGDKGWAKTAMVIRLRAALGRAALGDG